MHVEIVEKLLEVGIGLTKCSGQSGVQLPQVCDCIWVYMSCSHAHTVGW